MRNISLMSVLGVLCLHGQPSPESANNASQLNQTVQENRSITAEGFSDSEPPLVPRSQGDNDLGVQQILLRTQGKPKYFTLSSDLFANATDNAEYLDTNTEEDLYFSFNNTLRYNRPFKPWLRWEASANSQILRYSDNNDIDFEVLILRSGLSASLSGVKNAFVRWEWGYTTLHRDFYDDSFYDSLWSAAEYIQLLPIDFKQSILLRGQARFELMSSPDELQKASFLAEINYRYKLSPKWQISCLGRYTISPYRESDREDSNFVAGVFSRYQLSPSFAISANYYVIENQSNEATRDYNANTLSLGIGGSYQF